MVAAAGLFQTLSNGWNTVTSQVSKAYTGACNLTNAGWQKMMQYDAFKKTVDFSSRNFDKLSGYYPDALKFQWSKGTAIATAGTLLVAGGILRYRQTPLKEVNRQINDLEAKQKGLKAKDNADDLTAGDLAILAALKARKTELEA